MIPLIPYKLRAAKVLTPDAVNQGFRALRDAQRLAAEKRWSFDSVTIPFRPATGGTTPTAQLQLRLRMPYAYRIIGRDVYVWGDANATPYVLSVSGITVDDAEVFGAGVDTLAVTRDHKGVHVPASTEVVVTLTVPSGASLHRASCVLHTLIDRHAGSFPAEASFGEVDSNTTLAEAKAAVNAGITSVAARTASLANNTDRWRTSVHLFEVDQTGAIPALERDMPLPADNQTLWGYDLVVVADAACGAVGLTLLDAAAGVVDIVDLTGTGPSAQDHDSASDVDEDFGNNFMDAASDYALRWSRGTSSGIIYTAYAVLYWRT